MIPFAVFILFISGFTSAIGRTPDVKSAIIRNWDTLCVEDIDISDEFKFELSGTASHYAHRFHNRKTANGERFDMYAATAAHKSLPFGTILKVTNKHNNQATLVRINDRGPYVGRRIIDLSYFAAGEIKGMGIPKVKLEGFMFDEEIADMNLMDNYYFAYSTFDQPRCVPEESVNIIGSYGDFHSAYEGYKNMLNSGRFVYLLTQSVNSSQEVFYIGSIEPMVVMEKQILEIPNNKI